MCQKHKEYIKTFITGILSALIISSIYKFITNVQHINVMPNDTNGIECTSIDDQDDTDCDGIATYMYESSTGCYAQGVCNPGYMDTSADSYYRWECGYNCTGGQNITFSDCSCACQPVISQFCANQIVFNNIFHNNETILTEPTEEWQCELYTDYTHNAIYGTFSSFRDYIIILFTFTALYTIFSIIHDWTLIKYKNNLDHISFLPQSWEDFYITDFILNAGDIVKNKMQDIKCCKCTYYLLAPIWAIFVLIFMVVDYIFIHTIQPFFDCIRSKCYGKQLPYKIPTISYISASWVGVARFWMSVSTIGLLKWTSDGFSFDITANEPDKCECECVYVLKESDFYKLLFTTFLFIALNGKFLYSWTMETIHNKYYLYLISYSLSIENANKINPDECTGSMMREIETTEEQSKLRKLKNLTSTLNDEYYLMDNCDDKQKIERKQQLKGIQQELNDIEKKDKEIKQIEDELHEIAKTRANVKFLFRLMFFVLCIMYYMIWMSVSIINVVSINYYDYPDWVRVMGLVVAISGYIIGCVVYFGLNKIMKKNFKEKYNHK